MHLERVKNLTLIWRKKLKKPLQNPAQLEQLRKQQQELKELQPEAENGGIALPQLPALNSELTPLQDAY